MNSTKSPADLCPGVAPVPGSLADLLRSVSIHVSRFLLYVVLLCFLDIFLGSAVQNDQGFVEYRISGPLQYMWWYHVVGLIWISEFILACQQMTVAGAVVTYYFTR